MWLGACASTIGTFVQQFAQSWLVYDLTKDPFYLGLDLFLGQLPIMLLSLVGGVFADRLVFRRWRWAVLWRTRLFSVVADAGGT
jgi:hypothetical protein